MHEVHATVSSSKKETPAQKRQRMLQEQSLASELSSLKQQARGELFNERTIGAACWSYVLRKAGWDANAVRENIAHFGALPIDSERLREDSQLAILVPRDWDKITLGFIASTFNVVLDFIGFRNNDGSENTAIKHRLNNETLPEGSVIIIDRIVRRALCKKWPAYQAKNIQERGESPNSFIPLVLKNILFYDLEKSVLGEDIITRCGSYAGVSIASSWVVKGSSNPNPCINIYKDNGVLLSKLVSMCGCVVISMRV
jgi:hypothetical protein